MNRAVKIKLSVMMFLEFAIWGAWLPLIFGYLIELNFDTIQKALVMNAFAIASIAAMFFSNQFVDRNFSAEKFLAFSHLVGGLAILALPWVSDFWTFFGLMLLHCVFYVPTISITNSITFTHVEDAQKEFSQVRLWGTIGWIVVGMPFIFMFLDWTKMPVFGETPFVDWLGALLGSTKVGDVTIKTGLQPDDLHAAKSFIFIFAGVASLLLAGYSLLLPHTPPKPAAHAEDKVAWLESIKLLRHPFILVLFLVTFIDSVVHTGYFIYADSYLRSVGIQQNWIMPVMTIGQFAEIGTMAMLGFCLKALGWRNIMVLGILGHTARFGLFALAPMPWVAISVNVLHGICYAFFFATVYIFVDEFFPKDARTSAQGLFNLQILGMGPLVGYFLWPHLMSDFTTGSGDQAKVDFSNLLLIPAGVALVAAVLLFLFFWPPRKSTEHG